MQDPKPLVSVRSYRPEDFAHVKRLFVEVGVGHIFARANGRDLGCSHACLDVDRCCSQGEIASNVPDTPENKVRIEVGRQYIEDSLKGDLADISTFYMKPKGGHFWVAVDASNEQVIGCVGLEQKADHGELRRMYVDAKMRNRGIGKLLVDTLFAFAKTYGHDRVELTTLFAAKDTIRFYERMGFKQTHTSLYDQRLEIAHLKCPLV